MAAYTFYDDQEIQFSIVVAGLRKASLRFSMLETSTRLFMIDWTIVLIDHKKSSGGWNRVARAFQDDR
jgi:hypothetical protein